MTRKFEVSAYLDTPEDVAAYLEEIWPAGMPLWMAQRQASELNALHKSVSDIDNYHFVVSFSADDELHCARVKEFPAVVSLAESAEEALRNVRSVLAEIVERRTTGGLGSGAAENEVQYNLDVRARYEY